MSDRSMKKPGETRLKPRLGMLSMIGMTFGILKYVLSMVQGRPSLTSSSTWIALAGSLGIVLPSGSSVAFLYGFDSVSSAI